MFSHPIRVYWEDTDAGGVVYHAQYLAFLERARSEWMRALGWDQDAMRRGRDQERMRREHDLVFAVRAMQVDFRAPARLDDDLVATAVLRECRNASLVFAQDVRRGDDLLLSATVRIAVLAASTFRPRPIPESLLRELTALQDIQQHA